jgi:hypothetical protein
MLESQTPLVKITDRKRISFETLMKEVGDSNNAMKSEQKRILLQYTIIIITNINREAICWFVAVDGAKAACTGGIWVTEGTHNRRTSNSCAWRVAGENNLVSEVGFADPSVVVAVRRENSTCGGVG